MMLMEGMDIWLDEIRRYNHLLHLVSPAMLKDLPTHARECMRLLSGIREPLMADLGSGSGLPAIPYKLAHPESRVVLLERSENKCVFLERLIGRLDLEGIEVVQVDVLRHDEKYPAVLSRAFSPSETLEKAVLKIMEPGGCLYYMGNSSQAPLSEKMFAAGPAECMDGVAGRICLSQWRIIPR